MCRQTNCESEDFRGWVKNVAQQFSICMLLLATRGRPKNVVKCRYFFSPPIIKKVSFSVFSKSLFLLSSGFIKLFLRTETKVYAEL